jgi:two-component system response regulator TtrR
MQSKEQLVQSQTLYSIRPDQQDAAQQRLAQLGYDVVTFPSINQFLDKLDALMPGLIVADFDSPCGDGRELLTSLQNQSHSWPLIALGTSPSTADVVFAMQHGAVDFLEKPVAAEKLLASIRASLQQSQGQWPQQTGAAENDQQRREQRHHQALTSRENEVLELIAQGYTNRMVAEELGIVVSTVEFHRSNLMNKLNARSLRDLIACYQAA